MKTITIQAIDPVDRFARQNEVLVSRIVGWLTRDGWHPDLKGPTTIISIDSGAEYEIAESLESFRARLAAIKDAPTFGFTGFMPGFSRPLPPAFRPRLYENPCCSCGSHMRGLQMAFQNGGVCEVTASNPADKEVQICGNCIIETILKAFGPDYRASPNTEPPRVNEHYENTARALRQTLEYLKGIECDCGDPVICPSGRRARHHGYYYSGWAGLQLQKLLARLERGE